MKKEYIIAYDCGTTALKTVLISSDGTVIGDARADNPLIQKEASWAGNRTGRDMGEYL